MCISWQEILITITKLRQLYEKNKYSGNYEINFMVGLQFLDKFG